MSKTLLFSNIEMEKEGEKIVERKFREDRKMVALKKYTFFNWV